MELPYTKRPYTPSEQVQILHNRGLLFRDPLQAKDTLGFINYYRLRIYWMLFEDPAKKGTEPHYFRPQIYFEDIVELYTFDRKLRHLFLDAIERVEVAVRTRWANVMALKQGAFAHQNANNFKNPIIHRDLMDALKESYAKSDEIFASHYKQKYGLITPPIWASTELMTLTKLSKWFQETKSGAIKEEVAKQLGLTGAFLERYLHNLSQVRNTAAHHSRLWNRKFTVAMRTPSGNLPCGLPLTSFVTDDQSNRNIFNTALVTHFLLNHICPHHTWTNRLHILLEDRPALLKDSRFNYFPRQMGFPPDWKTRIPLPPAL